ncbi:carboxylesterase/lipase family protein [Stenotrophomonas chelatiphaga]|uniref:carboxylesterase/lipase family protein n=1 Tax=Stenotrophomonas chelatiphaga TaxID=517011 RepID=UPI002897AB74|nr:carboxylesterase family protein [Stenotrophomonas chelatiphaga]
MTLAAAPLLACSTPVRRATDPAAAGAASLTADGADAALQAGPFQGHLGSGVVAWHGIRYARASRFGLPAVEALPADPVDCADFGATAAQAKGAGGARSESDDPFFLNVWSPAADEARRPVLVWIHGGGFQTGAGSLYVGNELAASGDIVVVTFNYRLGAIGFSDFSALGIPNNRGLHDQIAALRWVRAHIALFGGDPDKVTVAGESAGATSVSLLLVARGVEPLFRAAILQSGSLNLLHDRDIAARQAIRYREILGDDAGSRAALEAAPVARFLDAQAQVAASFPGMIPAAPIYDGELLPASFDAARLADTPPIPLLAGAMREEIRFFELPGARSMLLRERGDLLAQVGWLLGRTAAGRIAATYPDTRTGNRDLATDANFQMPTRHFAERHVARGHRAWVYRFDLGGVLLGAAHAVDLTYLWPLNGVVFTALRGGPLSGQRRALAERMRTYWIAFVRDGDPGGSWPTYVLPERPTLILDRAERVENDPDKARREAWDGQEIEIARRPPGAST